MNVLDEARSVLSSALERHGGAACLTCSFQAEDMAVLHMAREFAPDLPVLFLETGYHFPETLAYRDEMAERWGLRLVNLEARLSREEHEAHFGILHKTNPSECCRLRKVEPLLAGLEPYDLWITGLRREQSPTRRHLQMEEKHTLPSGREIVKLNPLAAWTWRDVMAYCAANEIPLLPLYGQGYTSIGCAPCTAKPADPSNPRSGRWGGVKLECGIHTFDREGGS
ncbi:MAG: phosphoadenylyl-sulfate reductase [Bryobacteraceae bacterium]|nr:MAG: phosphoadenylyl-sulfate reductase [Bryobacteraceae bacterium]